MTDVLNCVLYEAYIRFILFISSNCYHYTYILEFVVLNIGHARNKQMLYDSRVCVVYILFADFILLCNLSKQIKIEIFK